jgi:predicted TIM-barrel fold metal-dependent hydrolase
MAEPERRPATEQGEIMEKGWAEAEPVEEEVIDCDAHIREELDDLIPYMDEGEEKRYAESEYFGYPSDGWDRSAGGRSGYASVEGPEDEREVMERFGLDTAVITPTRNLYHGLIGNRDVANELCRAYNRYLMDTWLSASDLFKGTVLVPVQDPEVGAEEIDKYGAEDDVVGVFLNPVGPEKALGDQRYEPVYEAAERHDLTVAIHGAATTHSTFPLQTNYFHKFLEVHSISHPFQQMAQITSIICRGIPERFDLRFVSMEAGLGWVPYIYRLDKEFLARPNEAPDLDRLPSEIWADDFWVVSQPMEETIPDGCIDAMAELAGGWDNLLFATDWPHWDFDAPSVVKKTMPRERWGQVYHENARAAFPGV